jgi:DNA repair protein RadC
MASSGQVRAFTMIGTQAVPVIVRAETCGGPAGLHVSGLLDGEALGVRLLATLRASGIELPTSIALDVRPARTGPGREVDLPAALAVLTATGRMRQDSVAGFVAVGGLTDAGTLAPVDGIAAMAIQTEARGLRLLCAACQANEAVLAASGTVIGVPALAAAVAHLTGIELPLAPAAALLRASEQHNWPGPPGFAEAPMTAGIAGGSAGDLPTNITPDRDTPPAGDAPPALFASTGPAGHRGRVREKVLTRGTDALADYELLETLLFLAFKTGDTKPLAKRLINRFGSFARVLATPQAQMLATPGVGEHAAVAFKIVRAAAERLALAEATERPLLNNWDRLMDYLTIVLAREPVEQFRVLFLDTRNRLLLDEAQARGTVNHTPVYPREVVKRALEVQATALMLVHNHPSGDPTPSRDDIDMTKEVKKAAGALSIVLHDHVIIGNGRWISFRKEGLL